MRGHRAKSLLAILISAFAMCFMAFVNRFPIVYSDTGTYILNGFSGEIPIDRPIWYCLFIRHISLAESLWLVIFTQAIATSYLLFRFLGIFLSQAKLWITHLLLSTILILTTGLSWTVSILMPDIFSAIGFLSLACLLLHPRLRMIEQLFMGLLIMASFGVHLSNIPLLGVLGAGLGVMWLVAKLRKRSFPVPFPRLAMAGGSMLLAFVLLPFGNAAFGGRLAWSEGSHVFRMNHLIETGVLQKHLQKNCPQAGYKICDYQDRLDYRFMWEWESPLYQTGGWDANREEYTRILKAVNRDPELMKMVFRNNLENLARQFFLYEVDVLMPFDMNSPPFKAIQQRFPSHVVPARSSLQHHNLLNSKEFNDKTAWVTSVALALMVCIFFHPGLRKALNWRMRWMLVLTFLLLLVNSYICGTLSTPWPRYQNRIAWIAVFDVMLAALLLIGKTPLWGRIIQALRPVEDGEKE